ncbi:MAG: hypothetical protein GY772_15840 [bacterium]|nr:hypothetical protein [bacterium]
MNHKDEQPRVLLGVLGTVAAPEFASLAELALEQHTCWTAVGPAPTEDTPFDGGVWLTGNHGEVAGPLTRIATPKHEHTESAWQALPGARVASAHSDAVGVPTLFIGRSWRMRQRSHRRVARGVHVGLRRGGRGRR